MSIEVSRYTLSDGVEIFSTDLGQAELLHNEMPFYFRYGVEVKPGDVVFDVGANIGVFTLYISRLTQGDVSIYAFEPIPFIFDILKRNVDSFSQANVKLYDCGLAETSKQTTFYYFDEASLFSSMYPRYDEMMSSKHMRSIFSKMPGEARQKILGSLEQPEEVTCQVRTVSEIIQENQLERVDLLKLDVEKVELEVIQGITTEDWPKIKQLTAEVHDFENRLVLFKDILNQQGFSQIHVHQVKGTKGSDVYYLYAKRNPE